MTHFKRYLEINKTAWNKRTPIHIKSNFYNNEKFNYQAQPDVDFKKKLDLYFR